MHPKYLFCIILIFSSCVVNAQKPDQVKFNYDAAWKEVSAMEEKGLPQSELRIVDKIYSAAKKEKNDPQLIKSIIYQLHISGYTDDSMIKNIERLENEIESSGFPVTNILHSLLADVFWRYYHINLYRFSQRSATLNFNNKDISTWSPEQIIENTIRNFQLSLEGAEKLKRIPIGRFEEILTSFNNSGKELRPTLYDFLAHRAVDVYINNEPDLIKPAYSFTLNNTGYFKESNQFINIPVVTRDTLAYKYYALKILQDLLRFHLKDSVPDALIDVDLKRLDFVYQYSTLPDKQERFLQALQNLDKKYRSFPSSTMILLRMAQYRNHSGILYQPLQGDSHKWDRRKAFELCSEAVRRFPASQGALLAYNFKQELMAKSLQTLVEGVNVPDQPFRALLKYRNLVSLTWRIIPVSREELLMKNHEWENKSDQEQRLIQYLSSKKPLRKGKVILPPDSDLHLHSVEIRLDAVPAGTYAVLFSNNDNYSTLDNGISCMFTTLSNLAYFHRNRDDATTDFYVVNRTTGEPVAGAKAQLYSSNFKSSELKKSGVFISDNQGYLKIPNQRSADNQVFMPFEVEISFNRDTIRTFDFSEFNTFGRFYQIQEPDRYLNETTYFFLDRAIYRPGQPLYYKGILVNNTEKKNPEIVPNRHLTISFYDVNSQLISQQQVTTNEYGSFSGSFTTPSSGLTGQMSIVASDNNSSRIYFSVEEYKRPRFEVIFDTLKESYRPGEQVTVRGKAAAYSGAAVGSASIQFRVVRRTIIPFWWEKVHGFPHSPEMEVTNGKSTTGTDGTFEINFMAVPDETVSRNSSAIFIYQVYADITDINGETHSSSIPVNIGYQSLKVDVEVKDIQKHSDDSTQTRFRIKSTNLEGQFVPAAGKITVWKLKSPAKAYRSRFWEQPDKFLYPEEEFHRYFPNDLYKDENDFYKWDKEKQVISKMFDTSVDSFFRLENVNGYDAGKYMLQVESSDRYGEEVKNAAYFEIQDVLSRKPATPVIFDLTEVKMKGQPGDTARIQVATSEKIKYLYEIEHDGKILESKWGNLDDALKSFQVPLKEEFRGNIAIHLVAVKDNRMYANTRIITVPFTNKELDIRFESFRDKLQPGQQEQWRIKISSKNADKVMAEMVATLYDASLDAFAPNEWHARFYNSLYSALYWQSQNGYGSKYPDHLLENWLQPKLKKVNLPQYAELIRFDQLYAYDVPFLAVESPAAFNGGRKTARRLKSFAPAMVMDTVTEEVNIKDEEGFDQVPYHTQSLNQDLTKVQSRKNFNETAFFYPDLRTNEKGEIILSFTIPEALTRWKMLGFAHTKDLKSGVIQNELVTQKDLMIVPNQPRFFREKDQMTFQAKVTGMTDQDLTGQARLEFFDALTMKPVDSLMGNTRNLRDFILKGRESANLQWNIHIPEGLQAVSYRIVARAGQFSDGEEMILPVVSNRILVTETMPMSIRGSQTKTFHFDKLLNDTSSTLRNHRYTLEFTSNPAWYAVQALPYLMEYPYECTEQVFSRFYANSLASYIANSNPRIKQVFDTWATIQGDALLSNLEKNQELKTALLQETPWVLQAKSESERKKNIALLFNLNRMAGEQEKALNQIANAQLENGGFPWFPGLPEDRYITQYIVAGFGHLQSLGVYQSAGQPKITSMIRKAVAFMDKEMNDAWKRLSKKPDSLKMNHLDYSVVQYLYARSFFRDIPVQDEFKPAQEYWLTQARTWCTEMNMYARGMIALALHRQGDDRVPMEIVWSLKQNALASPDQGMYWKQPAGYFWYQAPIETQSLMIEVFDEVAHDTASVEDMKVWLLTQKQNQDWRTTKATAEACYALLKRGTDLLADTSIPTISVGKEKLDPAKREDMNVEAGTGYFKTAWTAPEITPVLGNITIEKKSEGLAWGAAYWQYFEDLEKITPAATPLKLSRQLFKEVNTDKGPVIVPLSDTTLLHIGDLVKVRIEIRSDRTMEYIHLKDLRAGAFEPVETLSGYKYQDGLWYYQSPGDVSTSFFIGYLPKGTYVFEYPLRVSQVGNFSGGITTIQCMYAPEFSSHSEGGRVEVR